MATPATPAGDVRAQDRPRRAGDEGARLVDEVDDRRVGLFDGKTAPLVGPAITAVATAPVCSRGEAWHAADAPLPAAPPAICYTARRRVEWARRIAT
jgi:hypothetical protein